MTMASSLNTANRLASQKHTDGEREDVAMAGPLIDKSLSWMRFPARLEQQFLRDGAERRLRYVLISGVLSLFVFNGFLLADYLMAPDVFWLAVQVRLGVFTPGAVLLLAVGWWARDWALRVISPTLLECIVMLSGVCAAASLAFILSASHSPTSQYYHVGLMVVVMYGNVVQRLRFWYAVAFSLAVYGMHIGGVLMLPAFNPRLILPMVGLVGATVVFTLMANYALERDGRRHYLLSLRRKHVLHDLGDVQRRLEKLARMDALTGLYNRRHFHDYLAQVWQRARHGGQEVALIMVDVDHFKKYNDRYGHPAGDQCLSRVAQAMLDSLRRPGDLVARLGGEEFIAVLPDTDAATALKAAERIREAVVALGIVHEDSDTAPMVTVSLGVCSARGKPELADTDLIAMVDAALYQAKRAGRNRAEVQLSA